jgi:hypothetical protein
VKPFSQGVHKAAFYPDRRFSSLVAMSCGTILREKYCLLLERLDRFYNNYEMNFVSLQEVFGNPIYQDLPKILLKFNEIKHIQKSHPSLGAKRRKTQLFSWLGL